MKTPTAFELDQLMHRYDPIRAHKYYEEHKKLKGRKPGTHQVQKGTRTPAKLPVTKPHSRRQPGAAKARQRKELQEQIGRLEAKLKQLEQTIRKKMHEEASEDRKGKAKKERAAKERDKPKSAAEKAEIARDNEKYREKNQQKLKTAAKKASSKSGGSSSKTATSKRSVDDLKVLATKVRGQIQVAKQKLSAL